jgi:hypothetical protein
MELSKTGTSQKQFDDANKAKFAEIGKLKDGVSQHRVIAGPMRVDTIWYPTLVQKDGETVQGIRQIVRPDSGTVLDSIVKFDESLTKQVMKQQGESEDDIKKYKSPLRANSAYRFLVFDRDADNGGKPTLRLFDYPFSVNSQLQDLQTTKSKKHPGMLEYGLLVMYDVMIEKAKDPKIKNPIFATKYTTKPVTETLPLVTHNGQKIPIEWLNISPGQKNSPWKLEDYLTEEEIAAILEYKGDLAEACQADTEEEIAAKLEKFPIYLHAQIAWGENKGQPMFPLLSQPEILEKLSDFGNFLLLEKKEVQLQSKEDKKPKQIPINIGQQKNSGIATIEIEDEVASETSVIEKPKPIIQLGPKLNLNLPANPSVTLVADKKVDFVAPSAPVAPMRKVWPGAKK